MIFPSSQDRGVVVFLIWNDLSFQRRLSVGLSLVMVGLLVQAVSFNLYIGLPFLLFGNLLFLVRGCNNRVDFGRYDPSAQWERVPMDKLDQLFELDRRMVRWDRNALDISNPLGVVTFIAVGGGLALGVVVSRGALRILLLDLMVLLLPHWLTGARSVMRQPNLMLKARVIRQVLKNTRERTKAHRAELLMLLKGKARVPADLKLKIEIQDRPDAFLGLYGQVVLNRVQGKPYPYFYVVLVAKPALGLTDLTRDYEPPRKLVVERKRQSDVDVLVIRQKTTKTSGYHTKPQTMAMLLSEGIGLAERMVERVASDAAR